MSVARALVLSGGGARGAYEAGVWAWLNDHEWSPDIVCGSSVGAINGAAIVGGMSGDQLRDFWHSVDRPKVFRRRRWRNFVHYIRQLLGLSEGLAPIADTAPLRELLTQTIDFRRVRESDTMLVVTAVRVIDGAVRYFEGPTLAVEHIMASSAIPVVFPWEVIDDDAYWDGGLAVNTPLLPAIERGARDVVAVVFAPIHGGLERLPATRKEAGQWLLELATLSSAESLVSVLLALDGEPPLGEAHRGNRIIQVGSTRILTVAPATQLGFRSFLDFDPRKTDLLFETGYRDAGEQLHRALVSPATEASRVV